MEERNLRAKRYLQAESILNNLKHKNTKAATGSSKKIRKAKKRPSAHKSSADSVQTPNALLYRNTKGEMKKVEFLVSAPIVKEVEQTADTSSDHVNISEMFLKTYKQLMQSNIINDDFYKSVAYDKDKDSIVLFNENKDDYFEIYNKEGKVIEEHGKKQDLMKPNEFRTLVKEYHLNNLYC